MKFSNIAAAAGLGAGFVRAQGTIYCPAPAPPATSTVTVYAPASSTGLGSYVGTPVTYGGSSYLCSPYIYTAGPSCTSVDYGFSLTTVYVYATGSAPTKAAVAAYYGGSSVTVQVVQIITVGGGSGGSGGSGGNAGSVGSGNIGNGNSGSGNGVGSGNGNGAGSVNSGNCNGNGNCNIGNGNGDSGNGNGNNNGGVGVTPVSSGATPSATPAVPTIIPIILAADGTFETQQPGPNLGRRQSSTNAGSPSINAPLGSVLRFYFRSSGQGVAQTTDQNPCTPFLGGFNTGLNAFNPSGTVGFVFVDFIVTSSNGLVFYSLQVSGLCLPKFVLVVNAGGVFPSFSSTTSASGTAISGSSTSAPTTSPTSSTPTTSLGTASGGSSPTLLPREADAMKRAAEFRAKRVAA